MAVPSSTARLSRASTARSCRRRLLWRSTDRLVDRLLGEQLQDGGWNCDAPPSTRSSFHTTIRVLEAPRVRESARTQHGGDRGSCSRAGISAGATHVQVTLFRRSYRSRLDAIRVPTTWHYDILRDCTTCVMPVCDPTHASTRRWTLWRIGDIRTADGRSTSSAPTECCSTWSPSGEGQPLNTLRALRVLKWAAGEQTLTRHLGACS